MEDDKSFYQRRMREELQRASTSQDEGLVELHRRWAELYREKLCRIVQPTMTMDA